MPRFPAISPHAHAVSDRVYSTLADRAKAKNDVVYPLHVGDTYREPILEARAERQLSIEHSGLHKYAPVHGEPELIEAFVEFVARRHDVSLDRRCIQVMSGATAGLNVVTQVLLEAGDEVLLPSPFWPLCRGVIATKGAVPVQVPFFTRLDEPGFDAEALLESHVTERTAALYINSPNNPTGRVVPADVVDAMFRVAKRHDLWVLCDEAYEEIYFGPSAPTAVWKHAEIRDRAIVFHTLSKTYGFAGARIGFTHGPQRVMTAIRNMQTFQTYCAPRPMQFGGIQALRHGAPWVVETRARGRRRESRFDSGGACPRRRYFSVRGRGRAARAGRSRLHALSRTMCRPWRLADAGTFVRRALRAMDPALLYGSGPGSAGRGARAACASVSNNRLANHPSIEVDPGPVRARHPKTAA